jgi:hypothetical protein
MEALEFDKEITALLVIDPYNDFICDSSSREFAIEACGKAGGAAAVPALVVELKDPSINTQQDAVRALYLTSSRSAAQVLIGLLPSREWRMSLTAESGFEVLTHRSGASTGLMKPPLPDTYRKWVRWWKLTDRPRLFSRRINAAKSSLFRRLEASPHAQLLRREGRPSAILDW